ncbi:MAG: hypothetical protein U9N85_07320 [Bacteroidota bacterium]|nr:hypothetical protein [Bacteroidota bacterium]
MIVFITLLYGLGIIALVVGLIFLIVKRMEEKKQERFENRDN